MLQPYPEVKRDEIDENAIKVMNWLQSIIIGLRTLRSEMNINPGKVFRIVARTSSNTAKQDFGAYQSMIESLAKVKFSNWLAPTETPDNAAIVSVADLDIFVPLEDVIDKESEIKRLEKEIEKLQKDITVGRSRLDNPGYVQKAPAEVVAKERERVQAMEEKVAKAENSLKQLR